MVDRDPIERLADALDQPVRPDPGFAGRLLEDLLAEVEERAPSIDQTVTVVELSEGDDMERMNRWRWLAVAAAALIAFVGIVAVVRANQDNAVTADEPPTTDTVPVVGEEDDPESDESESAPTSTESAEEGLPNVVPTFSSYGLSVDEAGGVSIVSSMIDPDGNQMDGVLTVLEGGVEAGSYDQLQRPVNQFGLANLLFNFPLDPADGPRREVGLVLEADDGTDTVTLTQGWVMVEGTPFVAVMENHGKAAADNILPRFADLTITIEGNELSIVTEVFDPDDEQLTATAVLTENGEEILSDDQPSTPGADDSERFSFDLSVPDGAADRELELELAATSENGFVDFKLTWTHSTADPLTLNFTVDNSGH